MSFSVGHDPELGKFATVWRCLGEGFVPDEIPSTAEADLQCQHYVQYPEDENVPGLTNPPITRANYIKQTMLANVQRVRERFKHPEAKAKAKPYIARIVNHNQCINIPTFPDQEADLEDWLEPFGMGRDPIFRIWDHLIDEVQG